MPNPGPRTLDLRAVRDLLKGRRLRVLAPPHTDPSTGEPCRSHVLLTPLPGAGGCRRYRVECPRCDGYVEHVEQTPRGAVRRYDLPNPRRKTLRVSVLDPEREHGQARPPGSRPHNPCPLRHPRKPSPDKGACVIEGCDKREHCRGMCTGHLYRWRTAGKPDFYRFIAAGGPTGPEWVAGRPASAVNVGTGQASMEAAEK